MVGAVSIRGAQFSDLRESTISRAFGNVLEIGAGRGANFDLLPSTVDWRGTERDQRNIRRLEHRARRAGLFAPILNARAEKLRLDRDIRDDLASSDFSLVSTNELQVRSWPLPDMPVLFFEGHTTAPS